MIGLPITNLVGPLYSVLILLGESKEIPYHRLVELGHVALDNTEKENRVGGSQGFEESEESGKNSAGNGSIPRVDIGDEDDAGLA